MQRLAKLKTFSSEGIEAVPVEVDVSLVRFSKTTLVGLPEAVERAMVNSDFIHPQIGRMGQYPSGRDAEHSPR